MNKTIKRVIIAVLVIAFLAWGSTQFTVVNTAEQKAVVDAEKFDRVKYVDDIWESRLIPGVRENAFDLVSVLNAMAVDLEATRDFATVSVSNAFNYQVKGIGTVESVDTSSRKGIAEIKLDGYDGPIKIVLSIGPSVNGESIRDGAGFIAFGDFKDQTEYGQVARELNTRAGEATFNALDWPNSVGKKVAFSGMFTIKTTNQTNLKIDSIEIVPILAESSE